MGLWAHGFLFSVGEDASLTGKRPAPENNTPAKQAHRQIRTLENNPSAKPPFSRAQNDGKYGKIKLCISILNRRI